MILAEEFVQLPACLYARYSTTTTAVVENNAAYDLALPISRPIGASRPTCGVSAAITFTRLRSSGYTLHYYLYYCYMSYFKAWHRHRRNRFVA